MDFYTSKKLVEKDYRILEDKRLGELLNANIYKLHTDLDVEMILITCEYNPNKITLQSAWENILPLEASIVSILSKEIDVVYIVSGIEIHTGSKKEKKKSVDTTVPTVPEKLSSSNYPHIHLAVALKKNSDASIREIRSFANMLLNICDDVDVRSKSDRFGKKKKGRDLNIDNDAKILGYVFKNARFKDVYFSLGKRYPCTLFNTYSNPNIDTLFDKFINESCVFFNMKNLIIDSRNPIIPLVTDAPLTNLDKMIRIVDDYLKRNLLKINSRGIIYQLLPGSKCTWIEWGDNDKLIKLITTKQNTNILRKSRADFDDYTKGGYDNIFDGITISFDWIEFNDFFLQLSTGKITKYPIDAHCFAYFNIKYSDINSILDKPPERWLRIIENSNYLDKGELTKDGHILLKDLFELLRPKKHKVKSAFLFGSANCGKTSLIRPILNIFPPSTIMTVTKANSFELGSLKPDTQIIFLDEFSPGTSGLNRDQFLKLLEGKVPMAINSKGVNLCTIISNSKIIILGNDPSWLYHLNGSSLPSTYIDPAYLARIDPYPMIVIPDHLLSKSDLDDMLDNDTPHIILYLVKNYYGTSAFTDIFSHL